MLGDRRHVIGVAALGEDAGLDAGVHGLDPAAEHLGELGDVGDFGDGDALVAQHAGRAAGRDDLDAHVGQGACELFETGFVEDGDESSFDLHLASSFVDGRWRQSIRRAGGNEATAGQLQPRRATRSPRTWERA